VLALALHPLHKLLSARIGNRSKLASFIIVFSIMAIVILPTGVLISSLFSEVQELKVAYKNDSLVVPPPDTRVKDWPLVGEKLFDTWKLSSHNRAQ